jgi:hypothetical protein
MSLRNHVLRIAANHPEIREDLLGTLKFARPTYVDIKDLPDTIQAALKKVGFRRRNIGIEPRTRFQVQSFGGKGMRDFVALVDMATGKFKATYGSWGGPNPWSRGKPVDEDSKEYPIPMNVAVIQGTEGGGQPTYATILVSPDNVAKMLPKQEIELTDEEKMVLWVINTIKGGHRQIEFDYKRLGRYGPDNPAIKSLADKGLVKIMKNGIKVTTAGRNAAEGLRGRGFY